MKLMVVHESISFTINQAELERNKSWKSHLFSSAERQEAIGSI
jgi:hypothetical protein